MNTRYNIDTAALLAEVNIGVWSGRKLDRAVSDELNTEKNAASRDASRVNKNLLAGRPELAKIIQFGGQLRLWMHGQTLPWSDSGVRLLPVKHFMKFDKEMKQYEVTFWEMVDYFVTAYPTLITAQAMALGDMFSRDDYPAPDSIRDRFNFRVSYMPVPTSGDFRIDVGNEAAAELAAQLAQGNEERVAQALDDVKAKLKAHLMRMSERLTTEVVKDKKGEEVERNKIFKDTLLDGAVELVELVRGLNVVDDPDIEAVRKGLERAVAGVTVEDLRKSEGARTAVKQKVDALLSKYSF